MIRKTASPDSNARPIDEIPLLSARGNLPDLLLDSANFPLDLKAVSEAAATGSAFFQILRLKRLFRRGWLRVGIPEAECESIAEHCFGVAFLCLLYVPEELDKQKAVLMGLVHELGEIHTGDFTPSDGISKKDKHALEARAIARVLEDLSAELARYFITLWEEYEAQMSPEARFVKHMDYLEMGNQAAVYIAEGYSEALELLESARKGLAGTKYASFLQAKS